MSAEKCPRCGQTFDTGKVPEGYREFPVQVQCASCHAVLSVTAFGVVVFIRQGKP